MVCMGNICRSPMAEAVAAAMVEEAGLSDRVSVESFGAVGFHIGEPAFPPAVSALRRGGWKPTDHRARRVEREDVDRIDLVLCLDRANLADVRRLAGDRAGGKIHLLREYDPQSVAPDNEVPDPGAAPTAVTTPRWP
ncbi:MAG: low molecular weight phosphotyrosine protein phosphatase [Acidimicrobiales bacterium]